MQASGEDHDGNCLVCIGSVSADCGLQCRLACLCVAMLGAVVPGFVMDSRSAYCFQGIALENARGGEASLSGVEHTLWPVVFRGFLDIVSWTY